MSGGDKAVAVSSAILPLVTAQTVAFERGVGGWMRDYRLRSAYADFAYELTPTRSPRKPLHFNTLSSSLFAPAGLTLASEGSVQPTPPAKGIALL
jgi:hypothetical protein